MPGPKISNEAIFKIIDLKSQSNTSNRQISEILKINRNTINHYVKLYEEGEISTSQNRQFNALKQKSYKNTLRYGEFASFIRNYIDKKDTDLSLLAIWKEYKSRSQDGYGYTQFCKAFKKLSRIVVEQRDLGIDSHPILFCSLIKNKRVDSETGELSSITVIYLLFSRSGIFFKKRISDLTLDNTIEFLKEVFLQLRWIPAQIQILPYSIQNIKFPAEIIDPLKDWMSMIAIQVGPLAEVKGKKAVSKIINECLKYDTTSASTVSVDQAKDLGAKVESNFNLNRYVDEKGNLTKSEIFIALDQSNAISLPMSFPDPQKIVSVKVQKMSHIFLPEDRHYYSVPSKYIGLVLIIRYDSDVVGIYINDELICKHQRDYRSYKYTSNKEHFTDLNGWTKKYFLSLASRLGPSTTTYVTKLMDQYTSPEMGFKQVNAIIVLQKRYSKDAIEKACLKLLDSNMITYHNLKRSLGP